MWILSGTMTCLKVTTLQFFGRTTDWPNWLKSHIYANIFVKTNYWHTQFLIYTVVIFSEHVFKTVNELGQFVVSATNCCTLGWGPWCFVRRGWKITPSAWSAFVVGTFTILVWRGREHQTRALVFLISRVWVRVLVVTCASLPAQDTIGNFSKIIVCIKSYLVTSNGERLIV